VIRWRATKVVEHVGCLGGVASTVVPVVEVHGGGCVVCQGGTEVYRTVATPCGPQDGCTRGAHPSKNRALGTYEAPQSPIAMNLYLNVSPSRSRPKEQGRCRITCVRDAHASRVQLNEKRQWGQRTQ
jgi:hypothetical protein